MDRPELREKIQEILWQVRDTAQNFEGGDVASYIKSQNSYLDQILALMPDERQEGRREVVEWINEHEQDDGINGVYYFVVSKEAWQAQLKELGL